MKTTSPARRVVSGVVLQSRVRSLSKKAASDSGQCSLYLIASGPLLKKSESLRSDRVCHVRTQRELVDAFQSATKGAVWLSLHSATLGALAKHAPKMRGDQRLLVMDEMKELSHHLFRAFFRHVVIASSNLKFLQRDELVEVISSDDRDDLFVGGGVDFENKVVLLYRGNVEPMVVPFNWFKNKHSDAVANFSQFEIRDYGQTVGLGDFEAATDAILYEFDDEYRRRAKSRLVKEDDSPGGSIRRLRIQKRLKRSDFPGITEKAIARIERNEVARPHVKTLGVIAAALDVAVGQLGSY